MIDEVVSPRGLTNFQNNCYMSAIIQCLRGCEMSDLNLKHNEDWFKYMMKLLSKEKVDSNDLSSFISEFFNTHNHRDEFERHNFVQNMQADAREFLIYVLESIEKKTQINFSQAFSIKLLETIEKGCNNHKITKVLDENMLNLKLNLPSTQKFININDLLGEYFRKE